MNEADLPQSSRRSGGLGRAVQAGLDGEAVSASGLLSAIGGWRGVVESLLPATLYLIVYSFTQEANLAVIAPVIIVVLAVGWRLIRREPLTAALSGAVGVAVCVASVLLTGDGSNYFVPGFFINGAWILAHSISLMVGWPLIGLLLGFFRGSLTEWRRHARLRQAALVTTLIWIALFAARLAVQLPLYFAGHTEALGIARLVMGVPLFALGILFTWLVLSSVSAEVDRESAGDAASSTASSDE